MCCLISLAAGPRATLTNAAVGGVLLGLIEGANFWLGSYFHEAGQRQQYDQEQKAFGISPSGMMGPQPGLGGSSGIPGAGSSSDDEEELFGIEQTEDFEEAT